MFTKEKQRPREPSRARLFATLMLGLRRGPWLYIIAPLSGFLICFYAFSSGDASGKVAASRSKKNTLAPEQSDAARGAQASTARQHFAALVQQLQRACAAKDSTLLARVAARFDSLKRHAPELYDYNFWLTYINQKRLEFAPHHGAHAATMKPSQDRAAAARNAPAAHEPNPTSRSATIVSSKAASPAASGNKIASPRRSAGAMQKAPTPVLSENQKAEAEQLYVQGYKIMAYKNRTAYLQALVLFKKTQETAPDPRFKYHQKAGEKIALIEKELTKFDDR